MEKKKHITRNYMIGSLTVFLQRHICEMDLETSAKVMASFPFLSCSPSLSSLSFLLHDVLFLLLFYFCVFWKFGSNLLVWFTLAIPGSATSKTFLVCCFVFSKPGLCSIIPTFSKTALLLNEEERCLFGSCCTWNVSCCRIETLQDCWKRPSTVLVKAATSDSPISCQYLCLTIINRTDG